VSYPSPMFLMFLSSTGHVVSAHAGYGSCDKACHACGSKVLVLVASHIVRWMTCQIWTRCILLVGFSRTMG
jgi:hypothetical protein